MYNNRNTTTFNYHVLLLRIITTFHYFFQRTKYPRSGESTTTHNGEELVIRPTTVEEAPFCAACKYIHTMDMVFNAKIRLVLSVAFCAHLIREERS